MTSASATGRTHGELLHDLVGAVWRDPYYFPEHLVLTAQGQLAGPVSAWAARARTRDPEATTADHARELRASAVGFARTNGALAGTPFLIALVPAYMSVLWEQARMAMKIAALHGRDPRDPAIPAEVLYLRGFYDTPEAAARALSRLDAIPTRSGASIGVKLRSWIVLIYLILVLAGLLPEPATGSDRHSSGSRWAWAMRNGVAGVWFVITWVIPITCMIDMSHSCASDTRTLAARAIDYYAGGSEPAERDEAKTRRRARTGGHRLILVASLAVPLGLITLAVLDPVHHAHLVAVSGFLGLGVVLALWATAARA